MERNVSRLELPSVESKRPLNPGAEKRLGEVIPVLDYGFVYLVDYMGNDQAIEQAARVSYGTGTRKVSETRGLIRYLMRHEHTTPFEMVEFKFHAKMPIFVARQWVRHRTANINEYSARYSILDKEFYTPDPEVIAGQSTDNKQGRGDIVDPGKAELVRKMIIEDALRDYSHYEEMIGMGIAKELSRIGLGVDFYTQWYWKIDAHNLFKFLHLRKDTHAQWEIRQYADAMGKITEDALPIAWEAFVDYQLEAVNLSRLEKEILLAILKSREKVTAEEAISSASQIGLTNKRETEEMLAKFRHIGLISK